MVMHIKEPKCCKECPLSEYGKTYCQVCQIEGIEATMFQSDLTDRRPIWCPLEPEDDGWIPVGNGMLPEPTVPVLVTIINISLRRSVKVTCYDYDEWIVGKGEYVTAWQPLPGAYEERK